MDVLDWATIAFYSLILIYSVGVRIQNLKMRAQIRTMRETIIHMESDLNKVGIYHPEVQATMSSKPRDVDAEHGETDDEAPPQWEDQAAREGTDAQGNPNGNINHPH